MRVPITTPRMTWSTKLEVSIGPSYGDEVVLQSQPIKNHLANAVPVDASSVRYKDMLRNGYARPSFAADSAAMMRRRLVGTCFIANLPPISDPCEKNFQTGNN